MDDWKMVLTSESSSRRDGSPFMNLLMCAPLCDSLGKIRYFIGAQVDVSGIVKDCTELESLQRLIAREEREHDNGGGAGDDQHSENEFQRLCEMFNMQELDTARKWGGRMHMAPNETDSTMDNDHWNRPRLLLKVRYPDPNRTCDISHSNGKLSGIYQNVCHPKQLVSLR
jgi:hypothetical protein